jgi:hypothetical protein
MEQINTVSTKTTTKIKTHYVLLKKISLLLISLSLSINMVNSYAQPAPIISKSNITKAKTKAKAFAKLSLKLSKTFVGADKDFYQMNNTFFTAVAWILTSNKDNLEKVNSILPEELREILLDKSKSFAYSDDIDFVTVILLNGEDGGAYTKPE